MTPSKAQRAFIRSSAQLALLIRQARLAQGFSQLRLAETAGIRQTTLSDFERNPSKARIETAFRLLTALGLELRGANPSAGKEQ